MNENDEIPGQGKSKEQYESSAKIFVWAIAGLIIISICAYLADYFQLFD